MFFGQSERSLKHVLAAHPEWGDPIDRIVGVLGDVPTGGLIDPSLVARMARLTRFETLAFLDVLRDVGLGTLVVRVVDDAGVEMQRFPSVAAIPDRVANDLGDEIRVMPENIDIAFEPRLSGARPR